MHHDSLPSFHSVSSILNNQCYILVMRTILDHLFRLIYIFTEALRLLSTQEKNLDETSEKWGVW
jgi:hypothetical protein